MISTHGAEWSKCPQGTVKAQQIDYGVGISGRNGVENKKGEGKKRAKMPYRGPAGIVKATSR